MRTITTNLYTFDELSGKAKEKALQELHSTAEHAMANEIEFTEDGCLA